MNSGRAALETELRGLHIVLAPANFAASLVAYQICATVLVQYGTWYGTVACTSSNDQVYNVLTTCCACLRIRHAAHAQRNSFERCSSCSILAHASLLRDIRGFINEYMRLNFLLSTCILCSVFSRFGAVAGAHADQVSRWLQVAGAPVLLERHADPECVESRGHRATPSRPSLQQQQQLHDGSLFIAAHAPASRACIIWVVCTRSSRAQRSDTTRRWRSPWPGAPRPPAALAVFAEPQVSVGWRTCGASGQPTSALGQPISLSRTGDRRCEAGASIEHA